MQYPPDFGSGALRAASLGRVLSTSGREVHVPRLDSEGATGQVSRITASSGTDEATYVARFRGTNLDVSVTAVATASTATGVRDPLLAAIAATPELMGHVAKVTAVSTNALDVEAFEGITLTVTFTTNPSTHLSVAYTAAAAAPQYRFARAVEVVSVTSPKGMRTEGIRRPVAIAGAVLDLTQTHDGSGAYSVELLVRNMATGSATNETITWTQGGSAGATDTAAKNALEAKAFIESATINGTGDITVAGMPGYELSVVDSAATGGSAALAISLDTQADDLPRFALVLDDGQTPVFTAIPQTLPVGPLIGSIVCTADPSGRSTKYAVEAPGSSISGNVVYVETAVGDDWGRLYDTPSATRTPWPDPAWDGLDAADPNYAAIRL